jgi:hypothetical protein
VYSTAGSKTVSLTVVSPVNGQVIESKQDVVLVSDVPIDKAVTSEADLICPGESAILTVVESEEGILYQLINGGTGASTGDPQTGNGSDLVLESNALTGTTRINVRASNNGCSLDLSDSKLINVVARPAISQSGDNTLETEDDADAYQWFLNGEALEGENGSSISVNESGDYTVQVEKQGCTILSEVFSIVVSGIQEQFDGNVSVYPNPVRSRLILDLNDEFQGKIRISVRDYLGVQIYNEEYPNVGNGLVELDFSSFDQGIYFVNIGDGEKQVIRRVIKTN